MKKQEGTDGQNLNKIETDFNMGLIYEKLLSCLNYRIKVHLVCLSPLIITPGKHICL